MDDAFLEHEISEDVQDEKGREQEGVVIDGSEPSSQLLETM